MPDWGAYVFIDTGRFLPDPEWSGEGCILHCTSLELAERVGTLLAIHPGGQWTDLGIYSAEQLGATWTKADEHLRRIDEFDDKQVKRNAKIAAEICNWLSDNADPPADLADLTISLPSLAGRPEFVPTNDPRVAHDRLSQILLRFHRWVVDGGVFTHWCWESLLDEIRDEAEKAGLRTNSISRYEVWHRTSEAKSLGYECAIRTPPDDSEIVLFMTNGDGIQVNLRAGFGDDWNGVSGETSRQLAAQWARGWMAERERQLHGPRQQGIADDPRTDPKKVALTEADWCFLEAAAKKSRPLMGAELATNAGFTDPRRPCQRLCVLGLLAKPSPRGGYVITDAGRDMLEKRR